jgi:hypothetical protein
MESARLNWAEAHWIIVFHGVADTWLRPFDADGWRFRHRNPALSQLYIFPEQGRPPATLDDAQWLANCMAFDHDAPVSAVPNQYGDERSLAPMDERAVPPFHPVHPFTPAVAASFWETRDMAYDVAADARFNDPYGIRYNIGDRAEPDTDFTRRLGASRDRIALYAMAARQADVLAEYLLLWRLMEAADHRNGMTFAQEQLDSLRHREFGVLRVYDIFRGDLDTWTNAFEVYRERAVEEMDRLTREGEHNIVGYLYWRLRCGLAHGKRDCILDSQEYLQDVARALPIVKLLARIAVEG